MYIGIHTVYLGIPGNRTIDLPQASWVVFSLSDKDPEHSRTHVHTCERRVILKPGYGCLICQAASRLRNYRNATYTFQCDYEIGIYPYFGL